MTTEKAEGMRAAGRLAAQVLDFISPQVVPGVTTLDLNDACHQFILDHDAIPAPLDYNGFPKSICTSVNHVVCHGIPTDKRLKDGDVMNIDITVILDGWHGDTSRMFFVGDKRSVKARRVVDGAYAAMMAGIEAVKPGNTLGDVGHAISQCAKEHRLSAVRDYCGHGIGTEFHTEPQVLNFGNPGAGVRIEPGMFFTVEPMLNIGKASTKVLSDGWTVVTTDRELSAQWEHTLMVTEEGYEILTLST